MKKIKTITILLTLTLLFALVGCGEKESNVQTYTKTDVTYTSREVEVPATVVMPDTDEKVPFVVLCHGHGGDRNENVGLSTIANDMAEKGIASIRMDFPGCGQSNEKFTQNTLSNMKDDVKAGIDYMLKEYNVDKEKVGIFGYSMGGRITLELLAENAYDFNAVGLLAPAADTEDLKLLFGGPENWNKLKEEANSDKGYADFTTIFGQEQTLSKQFFDDLEKLTKDDLLKQATDNYKIPSVVIYADDDNCVSPEVSKDVAEAFGSEVINASGDQHSYGFFSDKTEIFDTVTNGAADFFEKNLK